MKSIKEYYSDLKEIIDSDLTEFKRNQKLVDFIADMKADAIEYADIRVHQAIEAVNNFIC